VFRLQSGQIRINGMESRVLPSDTLRLEEQAQRLYGGVPAIQRMHLQGYPYRAGGDLLGWMLGRMATRVRARYILSASAGEAEARDAAMLAVDTSLVDVSRPVTIDSLTMRFTPNGLSREVVFSGKPGTISGLKEMEDPGAATEASMIARAESFRRALRAPGVLVLLADETGETAIRGAKAAAAEKTIESLIARTRAGDTVEYGPSHIALGRRNFDRIVDAARNP
jgi:hypothetical protein